MRIRRLKFHINPEIPLDAHRKRTIRIYAIAAILASATVGSLIALPRDPALHSTLSQLGYISTETTLDGSNQVWQRVSIPEGATVQKPPDDDAVRH